MQYTIIPSPRHILILFVLCMAQNVAAIPVLDGNGTYLAADDLTVVTDGAITYEYLDLSTTVGLTVDNALLAHSGAGFGWATSSHVSTLFEVFDIVFAEAFNQSLITPTIDAFMLSYQSYLGFTGAGLTLGYYDSDLNNHQGSYTCVATTACGLNGYFTNTTSNFAGGNGIIGVHLVRTRDSSVSDGSGVAVPEPSSIALLAFGLLGFAATRRTKKQA